MDRLCCLCAVLLLLLATAPGFEAYSKRKKICSNLTPVCQSDRFDVVYSHYDERGCKVYKCQCRIPDSITCPQGNPELKSDSHGCQYYECVTTCPTQSQTCQGSRVSTFAGNDANGCPTYTCSCPPNPNRPTCNSNEQLQQGVDSSGCPNFFCQQVRTQCPERPTCTSEQELVSAGTVNDCEIFRCECLTPREPVCGIGSQPRLQDDGTGCPEYRCVANRNPCPPEPTCPSPHQVVSQDGVDGNNCVKYVCKCIPLAPIVCPDGYMMELHTDETCGCQYYKCEPNCEEKPNCPSPYQRAVVMAMRNNGCPSYTCECKQPEVISCAAADAHLTLTTATDGSNCEIYVCRSGTGNNNGGNRNCPVPACTNPTPTGAIDAVGCPIYTCNGNNGCPSPPVCNLNQLPIVTSYLGNCPVYSCPSGGTRNGGCPPRPQCRVGETELYIGDDDADCPQYICNRNGCPQPPSCTVGEQLVQTGINGLCTVYACQRTTRSCPPIPSCSMGQSPNFVRYDNNNCPVYTCPGTTRSCPPPNCLPGQTAMPAGSDAMGCPLYMCQGTTRGGTNCALPSFCSNGQLPPIVGNDAVGCPIYGSCFNRNNGGNGGVTVSCPAQPECEYYQFRVRSNQQFGTQSCTVYSCINLGDYRGTPRKCTDNPSYCDDRQTVETYAERYGKRKKCQRVQCKGYYY